MSVLEDLRRLSAAEEIFDYLGVPYEPSVINVARLHILRRMGQYLASEPITALSEHQLRARCRAVLEAAYADFVARTPIEERVFKVHKDAVKTKSGPKHPFVSLTAIAKK